MDSMEEAILESLTLIDYSLDKEIKNVVIKPNLCYYWDYSTGQTTDPRFVAALISLIRKKASPDTISIIESDASAMRLKYAFRMLGYEKLFRDSDVRLINLSEDETYPTETIVNAKKFHLAIPQTICNADLRINVPKIKYGPASIKISCAMKNIFGCNPYPKKFRYHSCLEEMIVALNKAMKFHLCIIDGNVVSGIRPRRLGLVMACKDAVAIDSAAARIAGINPKSIRYIKLANIEDLGNLSFVEKGIPLNYFGSRYPRKDTHRKLFEKARNLAGTRSLMRLGLSSKLGFK